MSSLRRQNMPIMLLSMNMSLNNFAVFSSEGTICSYYYFNFIIFEINYITEHRLDKIISLPRKFKIIYLASRAL